MSLTHGPGDGACLTPTRAVYDCIATWSRVPPEPEGIPDEIIRGYRATVHLGWGAYWLTQMARGVREHSLEDVTRFGLAIQGAVWFVERERRGVLSGWSRYRDGRHVVFAGGTHASPLEAARHMARACLDRFADSLALFVGSSDDNLLDLLGEVRRHRADAETAARVRAAAENAEVPDPSPLVAEAQTDVGRLGDMHRRRAERLPHAGGQGAGSPAPPSSVWHAALAAGREHLDGLGHAYQQLEALAIDAAPPAGCPVVKHPDGTFSVRGVPKGRLTYCQEKAVEALIRVYPSRLAGEGLVKAVTADKPGASDAVNILKRLAAKDPDWGSVIDLPGRGGQRKGYGLKW